MGLSITDIAEAAGVSTTTVSRVINNSPKLKAVTRKKVQDVIEELNYSPNPLARGLSNSKVFNIALLIDVGSAEYFNLFFYEVMHGIETTVAREGYCLIIASSTPEHKLETLEKMIREKRMGGVLLPSSLADAKTINWLIEWEFPFVIIGEIDNPSINCSWVDVNNKQGSMMAVNHLAAKGYKNIAFITGDMTQVFNRNRLEGFRTAMGYLEKKEIPNFKKSCDGSKNDSYQVMKTLLSEEIFPDAVICGNNIISFGVMKAVNEIGLKIPRDIGLVTFDNYPLAELLEPSLTSIIIDVFQLGELAATSLVTMIDNPSASPRQSLISTAIESRESTARGNNEE